MNTIQYSLRTGRQAVSWVGAFLVRNVQTRGLGKDFALILAVKMETGHPVGANKNIDSRIDMQTPLAILALLAGEICNRKNKNQQTNSKRYIHFAHRHVRTIKSSVQQ